uniref:Uncharacterized protein n=1 Tax=Meloidogyne floridensis TaxID=298350 RepID=A0A915NN93_9BILA
MNFIKNKTTNLDDYSLNLICKEEKINKIISKHLIILQETIYNLTLNLLLTKKVEELNKLLSHYYKEYPQLITNKLIELFGLIRFNYLRFLLPDISS